jgi:hypothetical protein
MSGIRPRAAEPDGTTAAAGTGTSAEERCVNLLRQIALAGGRIAPDAKPDAQHGYAYLLDGDDIERDLSLLALRNYLEERFFDAVSLCPKCDSHHLNVREICPGCRRAHLSKEGPLHHFRCGYVGIPSEFAPAEDGSYVCPKCNSRMRHLGSEFDRLGKAFACRGRGAAAIRCGSLLGGDEEPLSIADAPVYRSPVILEFLDHEVKRLQHFNSRFSILLAKCARAAMDQSNDDSAAQWLTRLRHCLREVDLIGQLADALYVVILPHTKRRAAEAVCQRIAAELGPHSPLALSTVEITEPRHLAPILAGLNAPGEP